MKRIRLTFLLMVSFFLSLPAIAQVAQPVDIRDINIADEADELPVKEETLQGYLDQLEGYVDQLEGYVDGLETLLNGGLPAALAGQGGLKIEGVASGTAVTVSPETAEAAIDDAVATDPVQTGGSYESSRTVVETGDAVGFHFTPDQLLLVKSASAVEDELQDYINITNNTETELLAAPGAGYYLYVTFFKVEQMGTTATKWALYDDDACDGGGTIVDEGYVSDTPPSGEIQGDGGWSVLKVPTANHALCFKAATTGADLAVRTRGYKSTQ